MKTNPVHHSCHCHCHCSGSAASPVRAETDVTRRRFIYAVGALTAGAWALPRVAVGAGEGQILQRTPPVRTALKVQPVLTYSLPQRREATSWREWGGVHTEAAAAAEAERIAGELGELSRKADFPLEILPVKRVKNVEQTGAIAQGTQDLTLIYAAGGSGRILEAMTNKEKWNLLFLRHEPGPVYLWYEIAHPRLLRKTVDDFGQPGLDVQDVVVDNADELLWRMRALHGLKNTLQKRIVAIGGASGWGAGGQKAPVMARELWKLDLRDYPYSELGPRIKRARQDSGLVRRCEEQAGRYLKEAGVSLHTTREFVNNAFVLCEVLKDVMAEARTDAITINSCMGTIMPMSETTACLPLSLLNDEGYLAFCESDFVVIPSGILLHYISGKPVFLNDPTYPHDGTVTLAHCTAPRKMDGQNYEPAKILTHFESDYGAAPKVEMKIGQEVTNLIPDFACKKWVGFEGAIIGNPFLDICRSQIDVRIKGDSGALLREMKGFHWMTSYGSYLREAGYALGKLGVELRNLSATPAA